MARTCTRVARGAVGIAVVALGASIVSAQTAAEPVGPGGYRREIRQERVRLGRGELQRLLDAGKNPRIDAATGEMIVDSIRDHLPADWRLEHDRAGPRSDSRGNPIVNGTPGLPAWAQPDVEALRTAIVQWRDTVIAARAGAGEGAADEAEGVLANFVGQAITRGIPIDDILDIDDAKTMTARVAAGVIDYLHFYENIRFANQELFGYAYQPAAYPARIDAFVRRNGRTLTEVQRLEPIGSNGQRGGVPSGCYANTTFARGMTNLSGQTDIWVTNGFDDASADVPTGFPLFFFYDCQDADNNDSVRVSTNGYISFFQQGGGALAGSSFSNDPISLTEDPDGFAAPWWDDLIVATAQGNTDRVSYKTEGVLDQRVFTVEWFSMSRLNGASNDYHFFQVKLYETTDVVELHLSNDWFSDTADDSTIGMENYDGAGGDCGPNCTNTNAALPPSNYRYTPSPRPANDACAGATPVINGSSVQGTLRHATAENITGCGQGTNRDVWYVYTAECAGVARIDTCGSRDLGGANAGVDTEIAVYSACPATPGNQVACNDDGAPAGCSSNDSIVNVPVAAGQQLWIRVAHFGDLAMRFGNGAFMLNVNLIANAPPGNDPCGNAQSLANGSNVTGNITCASNDGGSVCGASDTNPDIWYRFAAPTSGRLTVRTCGSRDNAGANTGPDTVVSIFSDCPGSGGVELTCNDDGFTTGCNALDSSASAILTAGQTVRIRVTHFGSTASRVGNGLVRVQSRFICVADYNENGQINSQDFFDFLGDFFVGAPASDVNLDGQINSQDFFDYVTAFFSGC